MSKEATAFALTVIVPPLFVHFSLLAWMHVMNMIGDRHPKLVELRRLGILLPYLFAFLWFLVGYASARFGEEMLETAFKRVYQCLQSDALSVTAPRVSGYVLIVYLISQWALSLLCRRRYARDQFVGYLDVLWLWLPFALVYWTGTGVYIYNTITQYLRLYLPCGKSPF